LAEVLIEPPSNEEHENKPDWRGARARPAAHEGAAATVPEAVKQVA
jgi:hypothetical protein